jgi:hypothetical protein
MVQKALFDDDNDDDDDDYYYYSLAFLPLDAV